MSHQTSGFSQEQQNYLVEALAQLGLERLFGGSPHTAEPEAAHVYGTPVDELCKEELKKLELHPLDMWSRLEAWTDAGEMATGLDQFLLRHLGFFNVEPNSPGYMIRMRLPGCLLRGDQMIALANVADTYAGGYAHVTTRGNLQLREIAPGDVLNVFFALRDAGLSCHGTGADSARNLTASPTAGFDRQELIDLLPCAVRLAQRIKATRELQAIPRKFNISFDNGGILSCVSDTNDISFQAVQVTGGIEPGVYCRILLGGITGHKDFARDTGVLCQPKDAVNVGHAMLRVFVEHGDRTNRKRARLKYLLDREGFDWFIARTEEALADIAPEVRLIHQSAEHDAPRGPIDRTGHIGIHPQAGEGLNYIGIAQEVGHLSSAQMRRIGEVAQRYGKNDVRLTVWQNTLIPHISDGDLQQATDSLAEVGLGHSATSFAAGAVACTGKAGCKLALAYTKQDATRIVRHLEDKFSLDSPINIHLTGCPNSCAQHYIGDIGLMGTTAEDNTEGYHIVLGGGNDSDRGLARPLCGPVAARDVCSVLETLVANYLHKRDGNETFLAFSRRQPDEALPALVQCSA
ncbi:NirA family protein [Phaeobacter sp. B1627]|uniref:NirA family protein n=1 Tax=Phaeobacter sp. B1627 TaxID=2583809 RepID=UPI00111B5C15|nr:NirA family protein [Phaeobacter sp. B1627]TNJ48410.1 NirA family protein [Phaeobacter sp. B1627]